MDLPKKEIFVDFEVKEESKGSVVIEGFANKAIVDRGGDLIPGDAWDLDNFKENPIIFFNHDRNLPIGKAVAVDASEEGLKMKVQISKSNSGHVPVIRDMIKEGILKTFSVGFDDKDSSTKNDEGVNVIKQAELFETSVVSIPMNQESTFAISKAMDSWKGKSYEEKKADILKIKEEFQPDLSELADEPDEEKIKFLEAVHAAIPAFMKEGKDQDEAIAHALSQARKSTGYKGELENEDFAALFKTALDTQISIADSNGIESTSEKQADQGEDVDTETVNLEDAKQDDDHVVSPTVDLQKSQLALTGSLVSIMKELLELTKSVDDSLKSMLDIKTNGEQPEDEERAEEEEEEEEEDSDSEEEEAKAALDRINEKLENYKKRLTRLAV